MKTTMIFIVAMTLSRLAFGQFPVNYNPDQQPTDQIQYFKPVEEDLFVGDCMPFSHNGVFYLYWLIDKGHHSALEGYGAHQWVLSTSTDIINWKHYDIALGLDEEWEKSICTGSVIHAKDAFYAFFATRSIQLSDGQRPKHKNDGKREELSFAVSEDGRSFRKLEPNPFFKAPDGYDPRNFRDPRVFADDEGYHLFISTAQAEPGMQGFGGSLAHLQSSDLRNWEIKEDVLTGQEHVPECPDYFKWGEWYYLVYGQGGATYYVKSRSPYGPWDYPRYQAIKEPFANVAKTAEFGNGRRLSAAWIGVRKDDTDDGRKLFGGNIVMRELVQQRDGTLDAKFTPELIPKTTGVLELPLTQGSSSSGTQDDLHIDSPNGIGFASLNGVPNNCRITLEIQPIGSIDEYGLQLRTADKASGGYRLNISANHQIVELGNVGIEAVEGLDQGITVDVIMTGDMIDVAIDNRRCLINRCPEQKGDQLWFYAKHGKVNFKSIKVYGLEE